MSNKVYVGNLPYSFTNDDLKDLFAAYASVRGAQVILDRATGRSRGFGFVDLEGPDAVRQVIQSLHDSELQGRRLTVTEARERESAGPRAGAGPRPSGGGHAGARPDGGGFAGPRAAGGGGVDRGPRGAGGGFTSDGPGSGRRGAPPRGRPKPDERDRWSDGGGRRRRSDRDLGED